MRSIARLFLLALGSTLLVVSPVSAQPQPQPQPQPQQPQPAQPRQPAQPAAAGGNPIQTLAEAREPAALREALDRVIAMGNQRAVIAIGARIRVGLSPELLDMAIDGLVAMGRPEGGTVLAELIDHRRPAVRRKVLEALVATRSPAAEPAIARALDDPDPAVRAAAARAAAELGARSPQVVDALFASVTRGSQEAATALGRVARPPQVNRILALIGEHPWDVISPIFGEMLRRPATPAPVKLQIITRLAAIETPGPRSFLQQYASSLGEDDPMRRQTEAALRPRPPAAGGAAPAANGNGRVAQAPSAGGAQ